MWALTLNLQKQIKRTIKKSGGGEEMRRRNQLRQWSACVWDSAKYSLHTLQCIWKFVNIIAENDLPPLELIKTNVLEAFNIIPLNWIQ